MNQQQRIDRLAEWYLKGGTKSELFKLAEGTWCYKTNGFVWDPFTDLNHARLLLEKCERRGLMKSVVIKGLFPGCREALRGTGGKASIACIGIELGVMATAQQITEAVEAVAFPEAVPPIPNCQASACHCRHMGLGQFVVTLCNDFEEIVSEGCANMHLLAGYRSRALDWPADAKLLNTEAVEAVAELGE